MVRNTGIACAFLLLLLTACGGGGGGGGGGQPPPVGNGQVQGVLQVASTNKAELEPNSSVGAAQALAASDSILGTAALSDAQSLLVPTDQPVHDFYRLTVGAENVRVVLTMAKDDTNTNDLDLFLLDDSGNTLLTSSEGVDQLTETVTTPGPGTYIVGVRAFAGTSEYLLSAGTTSTSSSFDRETTPAGAEFVAGELLVKYKQSASMQSLAAKHNMVPQSHVWNDAHLMKLTQPIRALGTPADGAKKMNGPGHEKNEALGRTLEALRKLRKDPTVAYAEPNYIRRALAIPNDKFYPLQWHYPAINLPQAWDVATTRGQGTIVAVIDTGILSGHPDFAGQLIGGYDFISDADRAADGDGRDVDPEDEGDGNRPGESSYHGTHVAGTVAAATNNTIGVAGVAWNTKIMALRALGKGGGTDVDIIESIKFAARLTNASGTVPPVKADVINMSLGGAGRSDTTQDVITAARAAGVIIVAAAGNDNSSQLFFPASYDGVISVSAVAYDLKRAPYSNFGTAIDIAAPGGDTSADLNGDKYSDGVLSLLKDDSSTPAVFNFVFYQGTSMACPHMAGVLALMRGVNSTITPAQVDSLISSGKITTDLGTAGRDNTFGHGLVDANKAVIEAGKLPGGGGPAPTEPVLSLSASSLDFDSFLDRLTVNASNAGGGTLNISSVTPDQPWITVAAPTTGVAPLQLNITVNRAGLADGVYSGNIAVASDATQGVSVQTITVSMRVSSATGAGDVGTVFVLLINPATGNALDQQASTTRAAGYRFSITGIPAGTYDIFAGTDRDNDDFICDIEDACGTLGRSITIPASGQITGLDFPVNNSQNQPQVLVKNRSGAKPLVKQVR